jgi:hypothetical protein
MFIVIQLSQTSSSVGQGLELNYMVSTLSDKLLQKLLLCSPQERQELRMCAERRLVGQFRSDHVARLRYLTSPSTSSNFKLHENASRRTILAIYTCFTRLSVQVGDAEIPSANRHHMNDPTSGGIAGPNLSILFRARMWA